ncbi:TerB N-terminal domain-containing protein [Clostridium sp.]|uniref:TerB N-terminal domain-containing protein n=1 Tax=Clostridium sp. TaxID=1506 RepID=UPI0028411C1D|nr:TerB N-terminal domain-containing protein [Clostridium sp.]MDR3595050.1 TerB N-terminal domain-containing protein [Clostridium sp.]
MTEKKSKTLCYFFALFLGGFGAHLFYIGKYKRGLLYLLFCWTYIPTLLGLIDMFFIHRWISDEQIIDNGKNKEKKFIIDNNNNVLSEISDKRNNVKNSGYITGNNSEKDNYYSDSYEKVETNSQEIESRNPKKIEEIAEFNRKETFYKKEVAASSELFYKAENIILQKYKHIRTPKSVIDSLNESKNPHKNRITNNGISIEISFSTSDTEFAKDSLQYRNTRGISCEFKSLSKYWTTFKDLDEDQKKWYFYWRDKALNGEYLNTDLSYIILFTYELLNYTFNEEAAFNVSMLERLYDNYKEIQPNVKRYLPNWISDFLFELGEKDLSEEWALTMATDSNKIYEKIAENINGLDKISVSYWKTYIQNYRETVFFTANKNKIYNTFKKSIALLQRTYKLENKDLLKLWFKEEEREYTRYLFASAVMARKVIQTEMKTIKYIPAERMYDEITALFRMSENVVRQISGEKRQLKVEENVLPDSLKELLIEEMQPKKNDKKITDRFQLVQENSTNFGTESIPKLEEEKEAEEKFSFDISRINMLNEQSTVLQDIFREKGYEDEEVEDVFTVKNFEKKVITTEQNNFNDKMPQNSGFSDMAVDEDEKFINSLKDSEIKFLAGFEELKRSIEESNLYFKQEGMMAGTFISNINEKANEYLEDNIIELNDEYYEIYEDYRDIINIIKEGAK